MKVFRPEIYVEFKGFDVRLSDVNYYPGLPGNTSGPPDTWEEDTPDDINFKVDTGDELLDHLLLEDHVEELSEKAIAKIIGD